MKSIFQGLPTFPKSILKSVPIKKVIPTEITSTGMVNHLRRVMCGSNQTQVCVLVTQLPEMWGFLHILSTFFLSLCDRIASWLCQRADNSNYFVFHQDFWTVLPARNAVMLLLCYFNQLVWRIRLKQPNQTKLYSLIITLSLQAMHSLIWSHLCLLWLFLSNSLSLFFPVFLSSCSQLQVLPGSLVPRSLSPDVCHCVLFVSL